MINSLCYQNDTVETSELVDMIGVDSLAGLVKTVMRVTCSRNGAFGVPLSNGESMRGMLHADFASREGDAWWAEYGIWHQHTANAAETQNMPGIP